LNGYKNGRVTEEGIQIDPINGIELTRALIESTIYTTGGERGTRTLDPGIMSAVL
jgi:hypothetical protein